jgi:hypothetical protein
MAQYAISRVRYSNDGSRVQRMRVHALRGPNLGTLGPPIEVTRSQVVIAIRQGCTFLVGADSPQAPVELVVCEEGPCLRATAVAELASGDDLGGLPEF